MKEIKIEKKCCECGWKFEGKKYSHIEFTVSDAKTLYCYKCACRKAGYVKLEDVIKILENMDWCNCCEDRALKEIKKLEDR